MNFTVPGEPVPKGRPRVCNGRTYTPKRTLQAEQAIRVYALQAKVRPLQGPVCIDMWFFLTRHKNGHERRVDLDNLVKTVMDALNVVAWIDDSQVVRIGASKVVDSPNAPRTVINVYSEEP